MAGGDDMRFSDAQLVQLHKEIRVHIEGEDKWRSDHDEWRKEQDSRFSQLLEATQRNTESVGKLIEETRDIVQLHKDLQGAARLGQKLQDFCIWLMKWGTIGGFVAGVIHYFVNHIKH